MEKSKNTKTAWALILLSILLALSGMMVVSADGPSPIPNQFYGTVTINGDPAPAGTIISAYIDGELRGSLEIGTAGNYGYDLNYLSVAGNDSDTITFRICGVLANETITWCGGCGPRRLNLSAEDAEAPVVTNPDANPPSIVADGAQLSRLNVTVRDNCAVGIVTVNLSAIGGSDAQVMECIGGDVYSTTTNAPVGTANGTYDLQVNASDIAGNYNDCVDIVLEIVPEVPFLCGDTNGDGKVDMDELFDAVDAYIAEPTDMDTLFCVIDAYIDTA
ncbi:MAG: Ig-like domain-containing protein [Candidatus Syntrophoarchaeum sp.]|nr:Ig-like domain-containing protein [Candidatus Syntrophoarchaeum sp.]